MASVLVDSNVILDVLTGDPTWLDWSSNALRSARNGGRLLINSIVYAEVSVRYSTMADLDVALGEHLFDRESLPFEAAFLAGKVFRRYRQRGGSRLTPLPDFLIGAHAVARYTLITRDTRRYRTDFPDVPLIAPD